MFTNKYERYEVSLVPEGLQIVMWQVLPNLGCGAIALVLLAACFMTDPYQGHARIWAVVGVSVLALVAVFGVRVETWIIGDGEIRYKQSVWKQELSCACAPGTPLVLRVEHVPCDLEGTEPPFPRIVHVIGQGGIEVGDGFMFRNRSTVGPFLEALGGVTSIEVDYLQSPRDGTRESRE